MPLRDHFRPPIHPGRTWQGFHALWPANLVTLLAEVLPAGYTAEPRVQLGKYYEIDVGASREETIDREDNGGGGGTAMLVRAAPKPTMTTDLEIRDLYTYEIQVFEQTEERTLVAAVEFVSPANKDRPEHRQAFVAKCVSLLSAGVCVSIIDVVTTRSRNLYEEVLDFLETSDESLKSPVPGLYAATLRSRKRLKARSQFETWFYPLALGQPTPELPIWLDNDRHVMLDLETSYEQTCRTLRIA